MTNLLPPAVRGLLKQTVVAGCLVCLVLELFYALGAIDGWLTFLTPLEVLQSLAKQVVYALLQGVVVGCVGALGLAPFLWMRLPDNWPAPELLIRKFIEVLLVFYLCHKTLGFLLQWATAMGFHPIPTGLPSRLLRGLLAAALALAIVLRSKTAESGEAGRWEGSMARRSLLGLGAASVAVSLTGPWPSARKPQSTPGVGAGKPNILLVTFDALSAEHMSLYGYGLPTTPNIAAFAQTGALFTNFYSCSTFTTPSVGSILTGRYPSETALYHLKGSLRGKAATQSFVRQLRDSGYVTLASVGNVYANPWRLGIGKDFSRIAPATSPYNHGAGALAPFDPILHSKIAEDENRLVALRERLGFLPPDHRARHTFADALTLLGNAQADQPYFLWVHVFSPHAPWKPSPPYLHSFLSTDEIRLLQDEALADLSPTRYSPSQQPMIDKARLRYAESLAEADAAFGSFMKIMQDSGRLANTAVIVSSDHGESFTGGVYSHGGPEQVRQIVHIPLIVRSAQDPVSAVVTAASDQTSLAPTILQLAGLPQPPWMSSPSLAFADPASAGGGLAFTQYLEPNSAFRAPTRGSVGVIDGQDQYVVDIASGRGIFRPLASAHIAGLDQSAEAPARAAALRRKLSLKFPGLVHRPD